MKSKVIMGVLLMLLFASMLTLAFTIQQVKVSGTIYIKADGSIDPPTANITSTDNITYTFTDNNYDEIVVERDNIVVDGATYTLEGAAIYLTDRSNVTIRNMRIENGGGIALYNSSDNTITGNNITNVSVVGIILQNSSGNRISGNNIITTSNCSIFLYIDSDDNSITGNNMTNSIQSVILVSSDNNNFSGNTIANNWDGVTLSSSSGNKFCHNHLINSSGKHVRIMTSGIPNSWDDGYPSGGNYWSDYSGTDSYSGPYQNETGSDGIGDTSYEIDANNTDRYPFIHQNMQVIIHYTQSHIGEATISYNDTDPGYGARIYSGESNMTFSPPDADGVRNLIIPLGSGRSNPVYDPIPNNTVHSVYVSDWHGKLYTVDGTGDVDIKSMTNDTGTFFWKDGAWHPPGEEHLGDDTPDPAGSAWLTGVMNISIYHGNGTDGPLLGSWIEQIWVTTGYSENTVVEPSSRLNGSYVNATGVPFSPPYVGSVGTWVYTYARLDIPFWQGEHFDVQGWTEQITATPPAFMATLFSPANLYVTDPMNRHVGAHPTTGEIVNEIPGAFYSGPGSHPQRIVIPDPLDGVYDIRIVGTSTGEYSLVVELATVEKTTTQTYVGNISVGQILQSQAIVSEGEMISTSPSAPVGGISIPVNKLSLLAPYIASTTLLAVAAVAVIYVKKRKRQTEINS